MEEFYETFNFPEDIVGSVREKNEAITNEEYQVQLIEEFAYLVW